MRHYRTLRSKEIYPYQLIVIVVFQLLFISSHYHVVLVNGAANCSLALALARTAQPQTCQNIPQCDTKCFETANSAAIDCKSSKTYCNENGSVCGYYETSGANSNDGLFNVTVQTRSIIFTKGFDGKVVTIRKNSFTATEVEINNQKCTVSTGTCGGNKLYIDCATINQGFYDECTDKSIPGSVLQYVFSLDVIDPCNNDNTPVPSPTCFSSNNTVYVKDIGLVPINQLQIGDRVQSDHYGTYTQVYGFGHHDHDSETDYKQFIMKDDGTNNEGLYPLEISSLHYIYILPRANDDAKINKNHKELMHMNDMITIRALDVIVGDKIWNGTQYQTIQSIQHVKRHGLYAPLTQSGHLIVSNVMVSNYVHLLNDNVNSYLLWNQHHLGHIIFFPLRYYCQHYINDCRKETYYNGYSYWAYYMVHFSSHMNHQYYFGWLNALLISWISIPMYIIATIIETTSFIFFGLLLLLLCSITLIIIRMKMKQT